MKTHVRIAVLILNYNGQRFLAPIFDSLNFLKNDPRADVVLIDNASHDSSVSLCRSEYPWVIAIRNDDNYGWGEGYNQGIKQLLKVASPYTHYLFLNNDTIPNQDWFDHLYRAAEHGIPSVAEWGCRTVFSDRIVTEALFCPDPVFADEEMKFLFLNSGSHSEILDKKLGPIFRACPSPKRIGIFRRFLSESLQGYTIQFENNRRREISVNLTDKLSVRSLGVVKGIQLLQVQEGISKTRSIVVPQRSKVLIYRSFSANHEFVPLIQNSGIGINAHFEGYDLQSYEPVTAPQNHHDFVGVCGVSKLVRADVFHELGGFDPRYFMYYEDLDFSLRLRKRGYKSELVVDAVLKHHHGGSSNVRSKFFARQVAWSLLYFQWQHASRFQKWKLLLATVMRARTEEDEGMYRSQQINRFALSKFKCLFDERSFSMHWLLRWAGGSIL